MPMRHESGIFEEPDLKAEAASIARAEDDIATGRVISNAEVIEWLRTWGTPEEKPAPPEWRR